MGVKSNALAGRRQAYSSGRFASAGRPPQPTGLVEVSLDFGAFFSLPNRRLHPGFGCGPVAMHGDGASSHESTPGPTATSFTRGDFNHAKWYREVV
jgi:hypothetical protein